ncbi:MAG TPA: hypothetical protein VF937_16725 [Chloroflexota bacterium]
MLPWIAVPMALAGWLLGWLSGALTDRLQPDQDSHAIRGRGPLVRDPLVQAALALIWAVIPFVRGSDPLVWVATGLLTVPLVQVAVTDLRTRFVYTVVAVIGLALGLALGWQVHGVAWWWSVVGAVGGAIAFGALYGLGRLIYRGGEPLARGDITIAAMVGAGAAACAAQALVIGVVLSGVLALAVLAISRSRHGFMPYGPGLCLGGLVSLFLC